MKKSMIGALLGLASLFGADVSSGVPVFMKKPQETPKKGMSGSKPLVFGPSARLYRIRQKFGPGRLRTLELAGCDLAKLAKLRGVEG